MMDTETTRRSVTNDEATVEATSNEQPDPVTLLKRFEKQNGVVRDLDKVAKVQDHNHEGVKFRYEQTIDIAEEYETTYVTVDRYESPISRLTVSYADRYKQIPTKAQKAMETTLDLEHHSESQTITQSVEQKTGAEPESCYHCSGTGRKDCYSCDGTGRTSCSKCRGDGTENCPNPPCNHGYIYCRNCDGNGKVSAESGGKITCPACQGNPKSVCGTCHGETEISCRNTDCLEGIVDCTYCDYNNEIECSTCEETGELVKITRGEIHYTVSQSLAYDDESPVSDRLARSFAARNELDECSLVEHDITENDLGPDTEVLQVETAYLIGDYDQITYSYNRSTHDLYHLSGAFTYGSLPKKRNRLLAYSILLVTVLSVALFFVGAEAVVSAASTSAFVSSSGIKSLSTIFDGGQK